MYTKLGARSNQVHSSMSPVLFLSSLFPICNLTRFNFFFFFKKKKIILLKNWAQPQEPNWTESSRPALPSSAASPALYGGGWSATRSRKSGYKRVCIRVTDDPTWTEHRKRYKGFWLLVDRFSTVVSSAHRNGCTASESGFHPQFPWVFSSASSPAVLLQRKPARPVPGSALG